ncbi:folate-binding protein [Microbulbifer sp.]|uniref:CAF17-like 4Fe-4S cluster assembly/insertion protein YgfZ n=1 Tax=Microbulbifer sp. TaxID=1908541 RepID=UPI002587FC7E|nr:folate-binding protein [Microbulbifer sp.]
MDQQQWQDFLTGMGAQWNNGAARFTESAHNVELQQGELQLVDLSPLGAISVTGPDSQKFLQGQLTCDLVNLPDGHSTLGSHCNPKGRMISAFQALKIDQSEFILLLPRDLAPIALAALKKYAVFFKTELTDISDTYHWLGFSGREAGTSASNLLSLAHHSSDDLTPGKLATFDHNGHRAIAVMLQERQVAIGLPIDQAADLWQKLAEKPATPGNYSHWVQQQIDAGIPQLYAATSEMFIPQMLNLQVLGGVNFKKGCYTGQEVVARMQYLGAAKRRLYRARIDNGELPAPGDEIFTATAGSSVGNLVLACEGGSTIDMLAVLTNRKVADGETLQLADGRVLELLELPYDAEADPLA